MGRRFDALLRAASLECAPLRGECWNPVPLPPPAPVIGTFSASSALDVVDKTGQGTKTVLLMRCVGEGRACTDQEVLEVVCGPTQSKLFSKVDGGGRLCILGVPWRPHDSLQFVPETSKDVEVKEKRCRGKGEIVAEERASEPVCQPTLKRPTAGQECVSEHVRAEREKAL